MNAAEIVNLRDEVQGRRTFLYSTVLALVLPFASLFAQVAPPSALPELLAYWPLASNALNAVADTNHGVVMGEADFHDALVLNGDAYVNFGSSLSITGSFSACLWICPATDDRLLRVLGKFQVSEDNREYCIFLNNGNRLWLFLSDNGSSDQGHAILKTTLLPAVSTQAWHHIAATWDASQGSDGLQLYVNGTNLPTADAQVSDIQSIHSGSADLTLGVYDVPVDTLIPVNSFQGELAQLALFKGVLTEAEVQDLYDLGRKGNLLPQLSAYLSEIPATQFYVPTNPAASGMSSLGGYGILSLSNLVDRTSGGSNGPPLTTPVLAVARVVYVDQAWGNDVFSGKASLIIGSDGPKKTIRAGLSAATSGDTVIIKEGHYGEDLNVAGRNLKVRFEGKVNLSGRRGADTITADPATNVISGAITNLFK